MSERSPQPDRSIARLAADQWGVFNLAQALAAGWTGYTIQRRRQVGLIEPLYPGVYRFAGSRRCWEQDALGATLWAGAGSALSGTAAARLYGLDGFGSETIQISTVYTKRPHGLPFKARRVDSHLLPEIHSLHGIPLTSIRRTIIDIAGTRDRRTEKALDQCLREGRATIGQMWLLYEQDWMRGRRGIAIMRMHLRDRTRSKAPDATELEKLLRSLIVEAALPEPHYEFPIMLSDGPKRLDAAYPDRMVAIECDSYAFHMQHSMFESDRRRDIELQLRGWRVLRFTWARLRWERPQVAEEIRLALARSSSGHSVADTPAG